MSDAPHIVYSPRPDATPETETQALADVYSFVLSCAEEKKRGGPTTSRPDDTKVRSGDDSRADKASISR
jgi:hypothetical protein